jgi:hypothetical protein
MAVSVGALEVLSGEPSVLVTSEWAERGFCAKCGSSLFFRVTAKGKYEGNASIALGALDDPSGIRLTTEWFSDRKPEGYSFAGELRCITEGQALAMLDDL